MRLTGFIKDNTAIDLNIDKIEFLRNKIRIGGSGVGKGGIISGIWIDRRWNYTITDDKILFIRRGKDGETIGMLILYGCKDISELFMRWFNGEQVNMRVRVKDTSQLNRAIIEPISPLI